MKKSRKAGIFALYIGKLLFRSVLFAAALILYILTGTGKITDFRGGISSFVAFLIWIVFFAEMLLHFFPLNKESIGCEKQFAIYFKPSGKEGAAHKPHTRIGVIAAWIALNGFIGILYLGGWIDKGIMVLISLGYSVCDVICILFFCPFQAWFMKNKCCHTCTVYNWDYAMMFTPFLFLPGVYTWSLLITAVLLLAVWEVRLHKYPERFFEDSNSNLSCAECQEWLCRYKK